LRTTEKAVLILSCIVGVAIALSLWNPHAKVSTLSQEYVKEKATRWARCLEGGVPLFLDVPVLVDQETVTIKIELPNEQPLVVARAKSRLKMQCPEPSRGILVYGPSTAWSSERRAKVYQEDGYLVIELVPRIQIAVSYESGTKVYLVRLELLKLGHTQISAYTTVALKSVQELTYVRSYDYSGTGKVYLNDDQVASFSVVKGDGVKVIIVYEMWG